MKGGDLSGDELEQTVDSIRDDLFTLMAGFPPVFGLSFTDVFNGFEGIDTYVHNARTWLSIGNEDKEEASLKRAKTELAGLVAVLADPAAVGVPPALPEGLTKLDHGLSAAIRNARAGNGNLFKLNQLEVMKSNLIDNTIIDVGIFGVPFPAVYTDLEELAMSLERAQFGDPFGSQVGRKEAVSDLADAEGAKRTVERRLVPHLPSRPRGTHRPTLNVKGDSIVG